MLFSSLRPQFVVHVFSGRAILFWDDPEYNWERLLSVCSMWCGMQQICSNICVAFGIIYINFKYLKYIRETGERQNPCKLTSRKIISPGAVYIILNVMISI